MALENRREEILVRMHELFGTVPDIATNVRNRALLDNESRPGLILLDGDETNMSAVRPGRVRMSPGVVLMKPQVYVVLKEPPKGIADQGQGTLLNGFRVEIINALSGDNDLLNLLGSNGGMEYLGMETDMKSGNTLKGQLRIDLALRYTFDPYK